MVYRVCVVILHHRPNSSLFPTRRSSDLMYPQRIGGTPVYFSMESSASHLRSGGVSPTGQRRVDADYSRADIFPTVALQLRTPPWLSIKPQLSVRQTFYTASLQCPDETETCFNRELRDDESISRFYAQ